MKSNRYRVYINPFDDLGNYTGYQEVTDDVEFDSIGDLAQDLDNTDYDIGIYRNNNVSITLRNDSGKYSDIDQLQSIFKYKRSDSLVKITWQQAEESIRPGFFKAGEATVTEELVIFVGLLNDDSLAMDLDTQKVQFTLLGRESRLDKTIVPSTLKVVNQTVTISIAQPGVFTTASPHGLVKNNPINFTTTGALPTGLTESSPYYVANVLSSTTFTISESVDGTELDTTGTQSGTHTLNNLFGRLISDVIYRCLNQAGIAQILTVSAGLINLGIDSTLDSMASLLNKSVWEAVTDLLLISNSVLYIKNDSVVIAPRTPTAAVQYHFYGQASGLGAENIQNITGIKNGLSRMFNYFSWANTEVSRSNQTSTAKYGVRSKKIEFDYINTPAKQTPILDSILSDFGMPKQEFFLYTPFDYTTEPLNLLDRVDIDYPTVHLPGDFPLPICGIAICGQDVLPDALWSFTIDQTVNFKIIGKSLDTKSSTYSLRLRRI